MINKLAGLKSFNSVITNKITDEFLEKILQENKNQFITSVVSLVSNNQALQECEPMSIIYATIKATALGFSVDPSLGQAYVIPFNDRKTDTKKAQLIIGYKGYIQSAVKSNLFKTINVVSVKEGELVEWDMITGAYKFQAKPNRASLETVGYAAFFSLHSGFEKTYYWSKEEVEKHEATHRKNKYMSNIWKNHFDEMAEKTVLRALLSKFAPLSTDMQEIHKFDQAIVEQGKDGQLEAHVDYADVIEEEQATQEQSFEEATPAEPTNADPTSTTTEAKPAKESQPQPDPEPDVNPDPKPTQAPKPDWRTKEKVKMPPVNNASVAKAKEEAQENVDKIKGNSPQAENEQSGLFDLFVTNLKRAKTPEELNELAEQNKVHLNKAEWAKELDKRRMDIIEIHISACNTRDAVELMTRRFGKWSEFKENEQAYIQAYVDNLKKGI